MKKSIQVSLFCLYLLACSTGFAQKKSKSAIPGNTGLMTESTFSGLKLRNIGPALMSGRIGDIAIHPKNENIWYVAVASGGLWKTTNAGVTWTPIFDKQKVYSIGCVTIDPSNPHVIWVGTGENVGGRHMSYGDGIYRSLDGGMNWENMGLKTSEHISKIIVHPEKSNVVWVAAQGPLWKKGGERGIYRTTDGGKTWIKTLGDDEWVGATDLVIDPRYPKILYAATWQRHRNVATYMGGGPGTAIYRSTDNGESWTKLTEGLPKSNMGKIGLAISPQNSDILYAAIELDRRTGGVYKSTDRGATWKKMSDAVSGATGPHYYQELYASPHKFERLYLMDAHMQISEDGGKTFTRFSRQHRHGDDHAIAFRKDDPDYVIVGTDGGVYESFDHGKNWRFMENLPVTQFYKVALDDAEPFYNIYGGTQDNSTQGGPSRTDNVHGIQNSDWRIVLDWDGHQPATEPGNPDIIYAERQEGNISRIDITTGEIIDIQPQPEAGETYERFNWDAPILVSPHDPIRIYFGSQRVWRSDNRGDSWTAISTDLTRNQERLTLPIMGETKGWDEAWDVSAMSNYNTITSLAESPKMDGLFYAGTDDGLLQVTENGGESWRKIEVGSIPGIPGTAFVNDIKADLHNENTVYVALDNHKYGDYKPYLVKSIDKGKTWRSIAGNIPNGTLVWRVVQDHIKPELMFLATEFGIYFTINAGNKWTKLTGGVPTISFRDLAIQKRENDLVGASFGRGFYVFDDYTPLREVSEEQLKKEATLFQTRKAWWYVPRSHLSFDDQKGSQGADHYVAPNPPFGAVFTYYLKDGLKTKEEIRKEKEKELKKQNKSVSFPGWDAVEAERMEGKPKIWITIKDSERNTVRRINGPVKKGFHRITWDLKYPAPDAVILASSSSEPEFTPEGLMVAPGTYTAILSKQINGIITDISGPVTFTVEQLREGALEGANPVDVAAFWRSYENTVRTVSAVGITLSKAIVKVNAMQTALSRATISPGELDKQLHKLRIDLLTLDQQLNGNRSKQQVGEKNNPTIGDRLFAVNRGISHSTYGPTVTNRRGLEIVAEELVGIQSTLILHLSTMNELSKALKEAGAPWVEGDELPDYKK